MKKRLSIAILFIFFMVGGCTAFVKTPDAPRMTKDELKAMLGNPDLVIIDVRYGKDWTDSDLKIKGAVRENPEAFESWAKKYPKDKTLVFYWAWPQEGTSASVAQKLMEMGYKKVFALKGGWSEWLKANYPTEKKWFYGR
jgi:rhodanese-related sulfurtransferase